MIALQNEMELPIGLVMKESGGKLPDSHLIDPIAAMRHMKIANYTLPLLLRKERKLRKKFKPRFNTDWQLRSDPDVQVY